MKKIVIPTALLIIIFVLIFTVYIPLQKKDLAETIANAPESIERVKLNIPANHRYKGTDNPVKIEELLRFLSDVKYESLVGNETAYIPSRASIIYLFNGDGESDFIVPYEQEVMIDQTFYKVRDGVLENEWLVRYYDSLE